MNQLTQQLKDGTMQILEVPLPSLDKGKVLVRNCYSVISAGTEGKTVSDARLGYIGKAMARKKELKMVFDMIKTQGIKETYKIVMNKLEAPSSLGYSCAGEVIAVGEDVNEFKVGDYVACGGTDACHAEVVAVAKNLCAKVPKEVNIKYAAFSTIAAIAIQGIRQAELRLGENAVVIGLGLIGQLTVQMLKAAGVRVFGIDIDQYAVNIAIASGADAAYIRNHAGIEEAIIDFSAGNGVDAVIITAGTSSLDPVEFAGRIARRKGKVVIVGAVPTGFSREHYYRKELDLRMSSSYGPGRYDPVYEEKGIDYPIGYVRWTENRNMLAYLELLEQNKLNPDLLITHTFELEQAPDAYQMILNKSEPFLGIVIKYADDIDITYKPIRVNTPITSNKQMANIGFIGAGSFAQNFLLPNLPNGIIRTGVVTSHGNNSYNVAKKFGFEWCSGNVNDIYSNSAINTVFIATRHNLHAHQVIESIKAGKNVFVEKPLCLTLEELAEIKKQYETTEKQVMVGFNRRFSPHIKKIKSLFSDNQPKSILYRINAGNIPKDHWIQDLKIGGGRIIGEVCHFIDLTMYIAGSPVKTIYATALPDSLNLNDTVNINITFENGSIATIGYYANGTKKFPKEYIEVFCHGNIAVCNDFKKTSWIGNSSGSLKTPQQDKGHRNEVHEFINAINSGKSIPISFSDSFISTLATFAAIHSIKLNKSINIQELFL